MGYRTNEDKRGHLRTPFKRDCFSTFICPGFKKESNMDRWKYRTESGCKESGFENLKTRFQDCKISRKQENKLSGWNENNLPFNQKRKQSFNQESKLSAKKVIRLCGKNEKEDARKGTACLCRKIEVFPVCLLAVWNERKLSGLLHGWITIKMYHNYSK